MTESIDHARCSELLASFHRGELGEQDARAVAGHLASCEECSVESAAVALLSKAPEDAVLTPAERTRMESSVMAAVSASDQDSATVVPISRKRVPIGARLAQALGAAAVVAVIATFAYLGLAGGGDDSDSGADTASRQAAELEADDKSAPEVAAAQDSAGSNDAGAGGTGEVLEAATGDSATTASTNFKTPQPTFALGRTLTSDRLERLGESGLESVRFAHAYRTTDRDRDTDLLDILVTEAARVSNDADAAQVRDCATRVMDTEDPVLPTFGLVGRLDEREVLVLGFAWTPKASGRLDRYMVWAWERGDCDVAVEYIDGRIRGSG